MEIKVGEYIRTKGGNIQKVLKIQPYYENGKNRSEYDYINTETFTQWKRYQIKKIVVKHSKNIIDLVEEDDIVILEYYVRKYGQRITRKFEVGIVYGKIYFDNRHCSFWYDLENKKWGNGKGFNPKIKSILTKELFNQNSYKIGE